MVRNANSVQAMTAPALAISRMRAAPDRLIGGLLIVVAATGYGLMPLFGIQAHQAGLGAAAVMACRFMLAAAGLWVVVAIRRPALPSWRVMLGAGMLGAVCWTIQSIGYLEAVTRLGAPLAALLLYTYPLMVVIIAMVTRRQRPHRRVLAASGLVMIGLGLVFTVGFEGIETLGVVAGLVSAATYSGYIVASEPLSERVDPFLFMALALTGAALSTGSIAVASTGIDAAAIARAAGPLAGLALLSTIVAATAFLLGVRRIGAPTAAVLSCMEVVVACGVATTALGDHLTPVQIAGCAAILAAAITLTRRTPAPQQ